ncbi:MAG: ribonuclease [Planctomycetaceae bacterium]|nr:ribonuclease [Planctomycetaceae bacterium]
MGFVIGMDEAGYGPNLGPLVVSATVWEVPGTPRRISFWKEFEGLIVQHTPKQRDEIQIADSKVVHDPVKGVGALERGVLAAWNLLQAPAGSLFKLWDHVAIVPLGTDHCEPWFALDDLALPQQTDLDDIARWAKLWFERCISQKVHLRAMRSDIVLTRRFNELTTQLDSKGLALSGISMRLLQSVLPLTQGQPTQVWCDKHGGRNRYDDLLQDIAGDTFIVRLEEGPERSRYRIGSLEICFQTRAEEHLPVALASMACKYLRESTMELFNRFWQSHLPELKQTKGYPQDARRFRDEIAATQLRLGIDDLDLWRNR